MIEIMRRVKVISEVSVIARLRGRMATTARSRCIDSAGDWTSPEDANAAVETEIMLEVFRRS